MHSENHIRSKFQFSHVQYSAASKLDITSEEEEFDESLLIAFEDMKPTRTSVHPPQPSLHTANLVDPVSSVSNKSKSKSK